MTAELRTEGATHGNVPGGAGHSNGEARPRPGVGKGLVHSRMGTGGQCGWKGGSQARVDGERLQRWAGRVPWVPPAPGGSELCQLRMEL